MRGMVLMMVMAVPALVFAGTTRLAATVDGTTNFFRQATAPRSRGTVKVSVAGLKPADVFAFGATGKNGMITVRRAADGTLTLGTTAGGETASVKADEVWLRVEFDFGTNKTPTAPGWLSWSREGTVWHPLGKDFTVDCAWPGATLPGPGFGCECRSSSTDGGFADVGDLGYSSCEAY